MLDETVRQKIAESYCSHILIALEAGDHGAPFRDFLDNWYAHHVGEGHLTAAGRPIWFNNPCAAKHQSALSKMHFVSKNAAAILAQAKTSRLKFIGLRSQKDQTVRLMVDHAVPISLMCQMMFKDAKIRSVGAIQTFLLHFYRLGVLTYEEDQRLNRLGLQRKMPDNWDKNDIFARYHAAAICC